MSPTIGCSIPSSFADSDDAAQQAAQHIAATIVSGADAVGDDDRRGAAVVGDDPVPDVVLVVALAVPARRDTRDEVDRRAQKVGLVDVVDTLQQAGDRSMPMPVSMFLRGSGPRISKFSLRCALAALVLHEDEIPDLDVAVLVGLGPPSMPYSGPRS